MTRVALAGLVVLGIVAMQGTARSQSPETIGDAEAGSAVFAANCAVCHGPGGEGRGVAADLRGVLERLTVEEVQQTIREGRNRMPSFERVLDPQQIDDVTAYLAQLSDEPDVSRRGPGMHRWWDDMMWDGGTGAFMWIWLLFGLLVMVLIIVGVVWLVRSLSSDGMSRPHSTPSAAREELDRRYARGEISREQYREIRDELDRPDG